MEKIRNKLIQFMIGRYGPDALYKTLIGTYFALFIVNIFVRSAVLSVIMWALFIWTMFRFFSRNIAARQKENIFYLQKTENLRRYFKKKKTMLTDKDHYYKKCKSCKNILRLPNVTGVHTAVCPVCKEKMEIRIK